MNCDKCQLLLNDFWDDELSASESASLRTHLEKCASCAVLHADFESILNCCDTLHEQPDCPPNSQALWLRISNLIESEHSALVVKEPLTVNAAAAPLNWWTRQMNRSWRLSFGQMAAGAAGVAVVTALVTFIGLQNAPNSRNLNAASPVQPGLYNQLSSGFGLTKPENRQHVEFENRLKEQQIAIDYWNRRVEARKRQWNRNIRDAFDRNVREIDGVLAEYKEQLQRNPHDEISEEMLDSALNDKMELLREFSEL